MATVAPPATSAVAAIIPRRTGDLTGDLAGDFGSDTSPNAGQVATIINNVLLEVETEVGDLPDLPAQLADYATWVVALGAAAQVELQFYPDDNTAATLEQWYQNAMARLHRVATSGGSSDEPPLPVFGFPDPVLEPQTTLITRL